MSFDVEILEKSFNKLKICADDFAASFYDNLFKLSPEIKPLFVNTNMPDQHKKLINALVLVVENLRNPEALTPVLYALGARHISYGAIPKYYDPVVQALLITLEAYLPEDWNTETKNAWQEALRSVCGLMLKGAGQEINLESQSKESVSKPLASTSTVSSSINSNLNSKIAINEQSIPLITVSDSINNLESNLEGAVKVNLVGDTENNLVKNNLDHDLQNNSTSNSSSNISVHLLPTQKKEQRSIITIQFDSREFREMFQETFEDWRVKYQQLQSKISRQTLSDNIKHIQEIPNQLINAFWNSPTWLVATIAVVIFTLIIVITDADSLIGRALGATESIGLLVALVLFVKEIPDRRKQFHYQAWSIVDAAHNVQVSYARILALQDLNADGVSLRGLAAPNAELVDINLSKANLSRSNLQSCDLSNANLSYANLDTANLSQAKLSGANLSRANLGFANLSQTNLSSVNFSYANLICANLSQANLSGANLEPASLSGANLEGAYLTGANLRNAKVSDFELSDAFLEGAIMPDGSKYTAA